MDARTFLFRLQCWALSCVTPMTSKKAKVWSGILALLFFFMVFGRDIKALWSNFASLKHWMLDQGTLGVLMMGSIVALLNVPPLFGYSSSIALCGFFYGFPGGIVPAWGGALAGSCGCFLLARWLQEKRILEIRRYLVRAISMTSLINIVRPGPSMPLPQSSLMRPYTSPEEENQALANILINKIEQAVQRGGIKFLFFFRLAPYPWAYSNVIFSLFPSLQLSTFAKASGMALGKLILYVWVGAELATGQTTRSIFSLAFAVIVGVGVSIYVYRTIRQEFAYNGENHEPMTPRDVQSPFPTEDAALLNDAITTRQRVSSVSPLSAL